MADQECPRCGAQFPTGDAWAKRAVSLLIPAPAVPDMATQVRCPRCGYVFADGEVRHLRAGPSGRARTLIALVAAGLLVLAVYLVLG
ncbi:MAG: zinc-ribbon domain-containing protein [Burkholderiales bacterium]|nr:zinc-ribbon domain-containing protein [Burkholderiales bacterium]